MKRLLAVLLVLIGFISNSNAQFSISVFGAVSIPTMALDRKFSLEAGVYFDVITNSEAAKQAKTKNAKDYYEGNTVTTLIFCVGLNYQL